MAPVWVSLGALGENSFAVRSYDVNVVLILVCIAPLTTTTHIETAPDNKAQLGEAMEFEK